ncbi:hypothetical protein [Pseudomonas chlororaphis]|uniref:hypothetical protein n=1 Tax=Pseudomonas chlororaphis TaxID=587753 RepID=UPI000B0789D1|nr:hypothetical protein [Pseudomonas chlororaphis]
MSQDINEVLADLDSAIAKAIDATKAAGLSQGVIVAELTDIPTHKSLTLQFVVWCRSQ